MFFCLRYSTFLKCSVFFFWFLAKKKKFCDIFIFLKDVSIQIHTFVYQLLGPFVLLWNLTYLKNRKPLVTLIDGGKKIDIHFYGTDHKNVSYVSIFSLSRDWT